MKDFIRFFPAIALITTGCIGALIGMSEKIYEGFITGGIIWGGIIYLLTSRGEE